MDKTAQERGIFNKLREWSNIPAEKATSFFAPEHERVMNKLRETDDAIRAELSGKAIEGVDPATGITQSAKELLKSARKNFLQNEFMTGISELGAFHQKMFQVVKQLDEFKIEVDKVHHQFLFQDMDEEKLNRLRSHMERKAKLEIADAMMKEAGMMDFFHKLHNAFTPRGRALAAWVKKYPKETKELRERGMKLVDAAQALLQNTLVVLKQMATARATRRPDAYKDSSDKIKAEFSKFSEGEKGFNSYYHNVVKPFIETKERIDAKRKQQEEMEKAKQEAAKAGPSGDQGPPTVPSLPSPAAPAEQAPITLNQPPIPAAFGPPGGSPPFAPVPRRTLQLVEEPEETPDSGPPDTEKTPPTLKGVAPPYNTTAHQRFLESLESMSGEDPGILAKYISKYASSIQGQDPTTAIELFSIVKRLRG
jgi:uncharacterized coiled-coil DUF342 family protein